jgi:hypothetical protein
LFTLGGVQLPAEMTVTDYREALASSNERVVASMKMYVSGMGSGISWANGQATRTNSPLYCSPPKRGLSGENYIDILNKAIDDFSGQATAKQLDEFPIGALLMRGLRTTFPCSAGK